MFSKITFPTLQIFARLANFVGFDAEGSVKKLSSNAARVIGRILLFIPVACNNLRGKDGVSSEEIEAMEAELTYLFLFVVLIALVGKKTIRLSHPRVKGYLDRLDIPCAE